MSNYPGTFHQVTKSDGVLHVAINRPKILNAMHRPCYTEFGEIFSIAAEDSDVRVIVLSGEGRGFCSGLDVAGSAGDFARDEDAESSRVAIKLGKTIRHFQECISKPYNIHKPVISVVHGACIGLGIDIITATDIRFASEDAKFSVREVDLGMTADIGTLQRLPKIVGNLGWVKDIAFSARTFGSKEALQQGLIQREFPNKDAALKSALELAQLIAQKSPVAVLGTKRSINYALDHTHADSLEQIAEFNSYSLGADFMEGCMAMLESISKKKPVIPTFSKL